MALFLSTGSGKTNMKKGLDTTNPGEDIYLYCLSMAFKKSSFLRVETSTEVASESVTKPPLPLL